MLLTDSVLVLPKISNKTAENLAALNIFKVADLLTYFPRYVQDNSQILSVSDLIEDESSIILGKITKFRSIRLKNRGGRSMQTAVFVDENGYDLQLMWFNQPFLEKTISEGSTYLIKGKLKTKGSKTTFYPDGLEVFNPEKESLKLGRITPVYKLTATIKLGWLRARIFDLLNNIKEIQDLKTIVEFTNKELGFDLELALKQIHFPDTEEMHKNASEHLSLLELISLQIKITESLSKQTKFLAHPITNFSKKINEFLRSLPFTPTTDQLNVINEVLGDLQSDTAKQRLVQGDVGSGKTLVAMAAAVATAAANKQAVILAPTTVLAAQHFNNFQKLLSPLNIECQLVSSHIKTDKRNKKTPAPILIGTSAVLARKKDLIKDLALVIVDEQHRFGVKQREELLAPIKEESKFQPHLINLTATPIPRTLAQTIFTESDVSTISTKPAGRLPIKTFVVPQNKREDSYNWIKEQLQNPNTQIYWICPLVEENEATEVKAAETTFKELQNIYKEAKISLLHGRLKAAEKEKTLSEFAAGHSQILVSTSVIEVGVDVANASIIVIEGAERFGLAQLHQLRGRVGRGEKQSWCFLFTTNSENQSANDRLEYFSKHQDGLEIATYDLELRGPGEVYGAKQSGIPNLKIAKLSDLAQIKKARDLSHKYINHANILKLLF